jgi:long-subunit fatty acid transport protein
VGAWLLTSGAYASPELPGQYDARSVGMAGTGATFLHNGASVFLNPAGLDGIENFAVTGVISPFLPKTTAPLEGPNDSSDSEFVLVPLFLAGGGYRIAAPVVLGLAVYPQNGFGANFADVQALGNESMELSVAIFEAAPALSFRIAEGLSVGASYRITYAQQKTSLIAPVFDPMVGMPVPTRLESDLSGTNFFGFQLGASYAATEDLHLAATFRSKVTTEVTGSTTMFGQDFDTTSEVSTPHRLLLGVDHEFMDDRLLLALNFKYLFYAGSNDEVDTTVETPMGDQTTTQELGWENVPAFGLGAEYMATEMVPVRLGYSFSVSATPEESANPFAPGPSPIHGLHAGTGVRLDSLDLDLGGQYVLQRGEAEPTGGLPGEYNFDAFVVSLSVTYHQ